MEVLCRLYVSIFLLNDHGKRRMFADYIWTDILFSILNFLFRNHIIAYVMFDKIINSCELNQEYMIIQREIAVLLICIHAVGFKIWSLINSWMDGRGGLIIRDYLLFCH